jgi:hypothetical protein
MVPSVSSWLPAIALGVSLGIAGYLIGNHRAPKVTEDHTARAARVIELLKSNQDIRVQLLDHYWSKDHMRLIGAVPGALLVEHRGKMLWVPWESLAFLEIGSTP